MPSVLCSRVFAPIRMQNQRKGLVLFLNLILSSSAFQLKDIIRVVKLFIGESIDLRIRFQDLSLDGLVFDGVDLT